MFKQQNNHCIQYKDNNGNMCFGLIVNFLKIENNFFCLIEKFKNLQHENNLLKHLSSVCLKYIDEFFTRAAATDQLDLIEWGYILNKSIIIKIENYFVFTPCSYLNEHD
jgi:hypothetical protein